MSWPRKTWNAISYVLIATGEKYSWFDINLGLDWYTLTYFVKYASFSPTVCVCVDSFFVLIYFWAFFVYARGICLADGQMTWCKRECVSWNQNYQNGKKVQFSELFSLAQCHADNMGQWPMSLCQLAMKQHKSHTPMVHKHTRNTDSCGHETVFSGDSYATTTEWLHISLYSIYAHQLVCILKRTEWHCWYTLGKKGCYTPGWCVFFVIISISSVHEV